MSTASATLTASPEVTHPTPSLRRSTIVSGLGAAAVTTAAAAALHAAGVSFDIDGEAIPLLGFAQMTFLGAVIGGLLLAGLNRWSGAARRRFLQVTGTLIVLTCGPSVALPDAVGTRISLVALHLLAAAIIVPVLARHART